MSRPFLPADRQESLASQAMRRSSTNAHHVEDHYRRSAR